MLIAGDIGGTKTDLAIYSIESGPRTPLAQTEVRSADYSSLQAVVAEFLEDVDLSVDAGSFAVAGPVIASCQVRASQPSRGRRGSQPLPPSAGPTRTFA
jgi:glucokinase